MNQRGLVLRAVGTGILGAFVLCMGVAGRAVAAVLAEDGQNRTTIVLAPTLTPYAQRAAVELADYLERITGTRPEVASLADEVHTPVTIWVGHHEGMAEIFAGLDLDLAHWEETLVAVRGDHVLLVGRDGVVDRFDGDRHPHEQGTAMAVYTFLQHMLGVRWFWPGELGEDVPENARLRLDDAVYRHRPLIQRYIQRFTNMSRNARSMYDLHGYGEHTEWSRQDLVDITEDLDAQAQDWHRRQRMFARGYRLPFTGQHAFNTWWERFGEEHPEYFALQPDGSRTPFPNPTNTKICISNPAVAERWADLWAGKLTRNPNLIIANINAGDSSASGLCTCADCRAWDVPGGRTFTARWAGGHNETWESLTDRYVKFWNTGSRLLRARMPEGRPFYVATLAYGETYREPPLQRRLDPGIQVGYVSAMGVNGPLPESREACFVRWEGWAGQAELMTWRPNLFYGLMATPAVLADRFAQAFGFMAERGLVGVNVDGQANHWSTQGLAYYLLAHLAWDPRADVDALIDDYMERAFGERSAGLMRRYFMAWEDTYDALRSLSSWLDVVVAFPDVYTPEFLAAQRRLLDEAAALAVDGKHRDRIGFVRIGLDFTEAQAQSVRAMSTLRAGGGARFEDTVRHAIEVTERRDALLRSQLPSFSLNNSQLARTAGSQNPWAARNYLGPVSEEYRALLNVDRGTSAMLPLEWQFRLDPDGVGTEQRWFDPETAAGLDWGALLVTAPWGEQLEGEEDDDPNAPRVQYLGVGWYRTQVELDRAPAADEEFWLRFGTVDESCWVYVNGIEVGAQDYRDMGDRYAWRKPRRFDITDAVKPGANEIVVKVQALAGQGGIPRPVFLDRLPANRVPAGRFPGGRAGPWTVAATEDEMAPFLSHDPDLSMYVGEASLRVTIDAGAPEAALYAKLDQVVPVSLLSDRRYEAIVRYRQEVDDASLAPTDRPLGFRIGGRWADGGRAWWTASSEPRTSADWQHMSILFTPETDVSSFRLTLFFRTRGTYWIDEVAVRPLAGRGAEAHFTSGGDRMEWSLAGEGAARIVQ